MVLLDHFSTPLPYGVLASCIIWNIVNIYLSNLIIRFVIPPSSHKKLQAERRKDAELDDMCRINATALIHACVAVPLALYCCLYDPAIIANPLNGKSTVFQITACIMSGYFLWDTAICAKNIQKYGPLFLCHAILSFMGIYCQGAATRARIPFYSALFMSTEISTPLLHIRWYLTKAKDTDSRFFKIINLSFISCFTVSRLILMEVKGFIPFFYDMFLGALKYEMSGQRKLLLVIVCGLWTILNYYWGLSLLRSQLRHRKPRQSEESKKKE